MATFYAKGDDLLNIKINQENKSCFSCLFREGRYCEENDIDLKLADVKDNILKFEIDYCDRYQGWSSTDDWN